MPHPIVPLRTVWLTALAALTVGCTDKDEGEASSTGTTTIPVTGNDADSDGYTSDVDCDDTNAAIYPGASEICNDKDDDCDGDIDEDVLEPITWAADADEDGFTDATDTVASCTPPDGYTTPSEDSDCDDTNPDIHPDADEYCDGIDNDCDTEVDEDAIDATAWHDDADGDGYGDPSTSVRACDPASGQVADGTDCDDEDDTLNPGADEVCDELDNDCDASVDEDPVDAPTWYDDADEDGFGDPTTGFSACEAPTGFIADNTDCDDTSDTAYPGAEEVCGDGIDNDCDTDVDEGSATWYLDADTDGYGDATTAITDCTQPSGYVADDTDCDDTESSVNPGATEVCGDGLDNDCDGTPNTCALSGTYDPTDATASLHGPGSSSSGAAVTVAGDVDGDGQDDVFVGAYAYDPYSVDDGGGFLVHGPLSGTTDLSTAADATIVGENRGDFAGYSVGALGDSDADGYDDLIIGANGFETDTATRNQGAVYVVRGPLSGTLDLGSADARFTGGALTDFLGFASAGVGDVDGDGVPDFAAAAYAEDSGGTSAGAVYLVAGSISGAVASTGASATITGESAGDEFGISVAGGGDFDGDGLADLVVGARYSDASGATDSGAAYVFTGTVSGAMTGADADTRILGGTADDQTGWAISLSGDFDGDGYDDLVASAVGASSSAGAVYVFSGPLTGDVSVSSATATFTGETASDQAGRSVTGASDMDGDGLNDLLIGAYSRDTGGNNAGAVYLVHGPLSGSVGLGSADAVFNGDAISQTAGTAVAGGADLDGDGLDDALIGAPGDDTAATNAGATWLWSGYGL